MTIGKNIGKVIPMKVSSMEPMMPRVTPELISLSGAIRERIGGLKEKLHPITAKAVSAVVADMNSYYSNLIEGHHTYPKDIERALQNDFSSNAGIDATLKIAKRQRISNHSRKIPKF